MQLVYVKVSINIFLEVTPVITFNVDRYLVHF